MGTCYKRFTTETQTDVTFLRMLGLEPDHKILDIGCGGGRLGYELINYLDIGNYYAFDKQKDWINTYRQQIKQHNLTPKKPTILLSDFTWKLNSHIKFEYVYAYSVFTHVDPLLVKTCLNNLRKHIDQDSQFYATMFVGEHERFQTDKIHPERPHEFLKASYNLDYFNDILKSVGYKLETIVPFFDCIGPSNASATAEHRMILIKLL